MTLNDLIAMLQTHAAEHGDREVLSGDYGAYVWNTGLVEPDTGRQIPAHRFYVDVNGRPIAFLTSPDHPGVAFLMHKRMEQKSFWPDPPPATWPTDLPANYQVITR